MVLYYNEHVNAYPWSVGGVVNVFSWVIFIFKFVMVPDDMAHEYTFSNQGILLSLVFVE